MLESKLHGRWFGHVPGVRPRFGGALFAFGTRELVRQQIWRWEGSDELPSELAERIVDHIVGPADFVDGDCEAGCSL